MEMNSTGRFSNRADDYVRYRPGYPVAIPNYLEHHFNLNTGKMIADIGAGTGISTALFLNAGYRVYAVEPNREMREKLTGLLSHYFGLTTVAGTAECTTLPDKSIDAVVAGQAFHWFDRWKSKAEFKRVLKAGGIVVLIWNERKTVTPFEMEYEDLIMKYGKDYVQIDHRNISDGDIENFFYPQPFAIKIFDNHQTFHFEGLKGRLSSSSYMPTKDDPGYAEMISELGKLYEKYNQHDEVRINYDTKLFAGIL
jgi:ubiquinone/menaquinone biosynthesis C-methylase UbiE